jgi:hypothetical protein
LHFTGHQLNHLLSVYGYWVVMLFVGLESIGMPMPGETMLIAASIYAGDDPRSRYRAGHCRSVVRCSAEDGHFGRSVCASGLVPGVHIGSPPRIRPPPLNHNRFNRFNFFSDGHLIVRSVWRHNTASRVMESIKYIETSQC